MSALKLVGLIGSLMISAALACSAGMVAMGVFSAMGAPTLSDAATFGAEAFVLLGLLVWLRSALRPAGARPR